MAIRRPWREEGGWLAVPVNMLAQHVTVEKVLVLADRSSLRKQSFIKPLSRQGYADKTGGIYFIHIIHHSFHTPPVCAQATRSFR